MFGGALSKCASLITVDPVLNAITVNAMVMGGALAVEPEIPRKRASKLISSK